MGRIQLKRGLESARSGITPADGEPIWVTDTKKLYVGDGTTPGGVVHLHALAEVSGTGTMAAVNDAPSDGKQYARKDAAWAEIVAGGYTLPIASPTVLGGVKVGTNLSIDGAGVLSATAGGSSQEPIERSWMGI